MVADRAGPSRYPIRRGLGFSITPIGARERIENLPIGPVRFREPESVKKRAGNGFALPIPADAVPGIGIR
jgi:hypothetical protein